MTQDYNISGQPVKLRGTPARIYTCCLLLLVFTCDTDTCGMRRGSGRWKNMTSAWCFNNRGPAELAGLRANEPDGRNTGYRGAGLTTGDLEPCGSVEVLRPDTVIEGMDIYGTVEVRAPRTTVRYCRIRSSGRYPVRVFPGGSLVIEYTEIIGTPSCEAAISQDNYAARRLDIHGSAGGLTAGSSVIIEQCYIHDLSAGPAPCCGIRQGRGRDLLVRNNTIVMPPGSAPAIMIATDTGPIDNVLIDGNTAIGGGAIISSRTGRRFPHLPPTNVRIINNRLGRDCGSGALSAEGGTTMRGNVWLGSGVPAW